MGKNEPRDWNALPLVLSVKNISEILRISRTSAYHLVHTNNFPVHRIGRRIIVSRDSLRWWLEEKHG